MIFRTENVLSLFLFVKVCVFLKIKTKKNIFIKWKINGAFENIYVIDSTQILIWLSDVTYYTISMYYVYIEMTIGYIELMVSIKHLKRVVV